MPTSIRKNQKFGQWILKKHLDAGGNGCVWKAVNATGEEVAIKLLTNIGRKPYARFQDEVRVIRQNSDIDGILPILDYYLPDSPEEETPWYVMPIAQPISAYLEDKYFDDIVNAIAKIAHTLTELHKRGISHRDIKPENILVRDDNFYLADFGLVEYPDKINLTSAKENIGAKWTMAPEMRRNGHTADGKPADIYSMAKTLWILLTKNKMGFDGQYRSDSINGLINFSIKRQFENSLTSYEEKVIFTKPLDDLLEKATSDSPLERPTSDEFLSQILELKHNISNQFLMWNAIQEKLFPFFKPARAVWDQKEDIIKVLNLICTYEINHMFYPNVGGLDLLKVTHGKEPNTIELITERTNKAIDLVRPKQLVFERFADSIEWNYFLLETDNLEPSGVGEIYLNHEEIVEVEDLNYIKRIHWDENSYLGKSLPSSARLVRRFMNGSFLIVQKTAAYNHIDMYSGLHNRMKTDEFRNYIEEKVQVYQKIVNDAEIKKKSQANNRTPRSWALHFLKEEARKEFRKYRSQIDDPFDDLED